MNSIFAKGDKQNDFCPLILSYEEIQKIIPANTIDHSDDSKLRSRLYSEWRWRFFDIKGRKLIEISRKYPNKEREYIDNTGKWINYSIDPSFDEYVVKTKYYYTNIDK